MKTEEGGEGRTPTRFYAPPHIAKHMFHSRKKVPREAIREPYETAAEQVHPHVSRNCHEGRGEILLSYEDFLKILIFWKFYID